MTGPIVFLLPAGGSGGAHSVLQEVAAMNKLGVRALVAVPGKVSDEIRTTYLDLSLPPDTIRNADGGSDLVELCRREGIHWAVATANQSVRTMVDSSAEAGFRCAYYIQDYEPLFYKVDSAEWVDARNSYEFPGVIRFAKTGWLQDIVRANHGVNVAKVEASVDHSIFYPPLATEGHDRALIGAMIRPSTPRRAPHRTARILNWLAKIRTEGIYAFGASVREMNEAGIELDERVQTLGYIGRHKAGELFRQTKVFLDLSDYQAFGRTAIEAMSCGALVVAPTLGGTREFGIPGINCFLVDARNTDRVREVVDLALGLSPDDEACMRWRAIETGQRYHPEKAAISIVEVLRSEA